ncbi:ferritin-like domain-containing protein [Hymenobacter segetis]|uniref:PA2169 family four-helix-bundle protein n=1 Tax=Hymenobacter segetis TaxID=2025509 RepID=A0ABU9LSJ4_9BACT
MATTNEKTSRAYIELLEINKTASKGYKEAADGVTNPQLKTELNRLAQQRTQFTNELTQQASRLGVDPNKTTFEGAATEVVAAVHRSWINVKAAVTGHNDAAILNECETGDTSALKAYDAALKAPDMPTPVKTVIEHQRSEIMAAKNAVTQLKSKMKPM